MNIKAIGVLEFTSPKNRNTIDREAGKQVVTKIEERLNKQKYYRLVDRASLDKLLAERQLKFSDFAMGGGKDLKLRDVDAIISGNVTRFQFDRKRGKIRVVRKKKQYVRYVGFMEKTVIDTIPGDYIEADLAVTFRMVDTNTGDVIAVKSGSAGFQSRGHRSHGTERVDIPTSELPDRGAVLDTLLNMVVDGFVKLIAPHTIYKDVKLLATSPEAERGIKLAQNGIMDKALVAFQQAAQVEVPPDAALYNQGVILEAMGQLRQAEAAYNKAFETNPDSQMYMAALKRVKEIIAKKEKGAQ
jgi:curli biogenesis system outer membrane secretion channel CsgG